MFLQHKNIHRVIDQDIPKPNELYHRTINSLQRNGHTVFFTLCAYKNLSRYIRKGRVCKVFETLTAQKGNGNSQSKIRVVSKIRNKLIKPEHREIFVRLAYKAKNGPEKRKLDALMEEIGDIINHYFKNHPSTKKKLIKYFRKTRLTNSELEEQFKNDLAIILLELGSTKNMKFTVVTFNVYFHVLKLALEDFKFGYFTRFKKGKRPLQILPILTPLCDNFNFVCDLDSNLPIAWKVYQSP